MVTLLACGSLLLASARVHYKYHWQSSTEVLRRGAGYSLSNEALRIGGGRRGAKGQTREVGGGRWERERKKRRRKQWELEVRRRKERRNQWIVEPMEQGEERWSRKDGGRREGEGGGREEGGREGEREKI